MNNKKTIFQSRCPYCNEFNCYNSGFSIECINPKCNFYDKNHADFICMELNKMNNVSGSMITEPEQNLLTNEEDEDLDYYGYISSWYPQTVLKHRP